MELRNYGREELQADLVLLAVVVALVTLTYNTFE